MYFFSKVFLLLKIQASKHLALKTKIFEAKTKKTTYGKSVYGLCKRTCKYFQSVTSKNICISLVKYSYFWKIQASKDNLHRNQKYFEEKQKTNYGKSVYGLGKRTCKYIQAVTSENICFSNNKSGAKSCIIDDSGWVCIDSKQRMVLIIHCLLYNLNFNHCQQTTVKSICWLIKSIIPIYWHDDVQHKYCWISTSQTNKSCQHYYFDVMTNFKRQDKYYWISTSRDNKSCRIVMASWPTLNIQRKKSLGHRHHRKHIPNSGKK